MRLDLKSPIACTDGAFGELIDVVIDPTTKRVTDLVVQSHDSLAPAQLAPIALARTPAGAGLVLDCTLEQARQLAAIEEFAYLRLGEFPLDDPDWDVGIQQVFALPYYDALGLETVPTGDDLHFGTTYDRVPKGEVEIRRSSEVTSAEGRWLGHVEGFVVDAAGGITHVVLEHGHLWGQREVTIPISAVARVETDEITLNLESDEIGALESVPVNRWRG